ncbi:uncharacterized protein BDV17DRAFT_260095 [Aspergillus undulatus]|uniref:uncharacterized protein n=1 Tax=Aspergillus undulatus TaxID=1810928 RepID=UPI003CCD6455
MASAVASIPPVTATNALDSSVDHKVSPINTTIPLEVADESALSSISSKYEPESESQLHPPSDPDNLGLTSTKPNHLVTSPYTTPEHQLDLSTLDTANRLLAQALTALTTTRPDYATAPYVESFNWSMVVEKLHSLASQESVKWKRTSFYVVAFRSILRANADGDRLHLLDERSHAEAVKSGGLLKYWFGSKNERRENLATCVWRNREDAKAGGTGPWHAQARGAARTMYEKIEFTTMELVLGVGVGEYVFRAWKD